MEDGKLNGKFHWSIVPTVPIATASLSGEFDLNASEVSKLEVAVPDRTTGVLLDLSSVTFMDSTGLRFLLDLKQQLEARQVRLFINKMSPQVDRLLEVSGISSLFEYTNGHNTNGHKRSRWGSFREARSRKKVK